jgi:hypothetical protein
MAKMKLKGGGDFTQNIELLIFMHTLHYEKYVFNLHC